MAGETSGEVMVLDISKVKDLSKLYVKPNSVLIESINTSKSGLILPGSVKGSATMKLVINKVGSNAANLVSEGDVVVDMTYGGVEYLSHGERKFILCDVYNVLLVTPSNNWEE